MNLLTAHLWIGALVAALAVLAVWQRLGRRVTLYVVTLQLALGVALMVEGLTVPWYHYGLAILGWVGYMVANAMTRRGQERRTILAVTAVSSVVLLIAFAIGQGAVRAGYGGS